MRDDSTNIYKIIEVAQLSPGAMYGIAPGDEIVAIEGQHLKDRKLNDVLNLLNPKYASTLTIDIRRNDIIYTIKLSLFDRL